MKKTLQTPVSEIKGIGFRYAAKLKRLKIETVKDLLWHFPRRYEDFSKIKKINDLKVGEEATIRGQVKNIGLRRSWQKRFIILEALISDESGSIKAIWFNQPYIRNTVKPGAILNLAGEVVLKKKERYLYSPIYEAITPGAETKHTGRIIPIYPETKGFTSRGIRYLIKPLLDEIKIPEIIPEEILKKEKLPEINSALKNIHFPKTKTDVLLAKKRFAFEDLLLLQLCNMRQRLEAAEKKSFSIKTDIDYLKKLISSLPFELTQSQKRVLWQIIKDIAKPYPMNRLLQGDVGSGKTIVAALAALQVAKNNLQAVFMAPTEILARQHYQTFLKFFPKFDAGIGLLTGSGAKIFYGEGLEAEIKKKELAEKAAKKEIKVLVGTHALIQKNISLAKLGLLIVDEQHRFGVKQRAELIKRGSKVPHFLSMSATPIPRTLSLTIFGDLDLSLISEMPKNRKRIITKVVPPAKRIRAYEFIHQEIKKGRQVFVVCPRIEAPKEDEKTKKELEIKSVEKEYQKLSIKVFPNLKVGMLHGKMPKKEKEKTIKDFAYNKINILVSTSVIEVGVDIPNASIMMIEGAERFGLAQLYQFRGRVGRGSYQSYCFLFTESSSKSVLKRLSLVEKAKNGLELAEEDLKIRGPGEFLGESQTGMPDLAMKALRNPDLVEKTKELAKELIKKDPTLAKYPLLKNRLGEFKKEIHRE